MGVDAMLLGMGATNNMQQTKSDLNVMRKIERDSLCNKEYSQLLEFEDLCSKMVSGRAKEIDAKYANISVDVNYWTLALKIAEIIKAKTFMIQKHKEFIQRLKKEKEWKTNEMKQFDENA